MHINEHIQMAQEFLGRSDRYFAEGDRLQGSEKLWGAAAHAITAVARRRGWKLGRHIDMRENTQALASELAEPILFQRFKVAEKFHSNFYHGFMDTPEIESLRPSVHRFVNRVLSLPEMNNPAEVS